MPPALQSTMDWISFLSTVHNSEEIGFKEREREREIVGKERKKEKPTR